jgi:endonuclease/exonuclease/phosphatase family metal-dependent hydrolase
MVTSHRPFFSLAVLLLTCVPVARGAAAQGGSETNLKVMTYNVWHGLRSGESNKRFPGEDPQRAAERFDRQIEEIKKLDPDVLLFQEVNPNQKQARKYAAALGYDEIHKVTSCGLHLGAIYKIPKNVNDGIAILAKPEYNLKRVGKKRLSGNATCTASWGFQTKESRYGLFGEITVDGRKILVATTHLSSPVFVLPDFDQQLEGLVADGTLTQEQHDEIQTARESKSQRNVNETKGMLAQMATRSARMGGNDGSAPIIFGGDFNAEPKTPGIRAVYAAGFEETGTGDDFHTWDPVTNEANYSIGTRRHDPLPTFDKPEVEELLAYRSTVPRQIDHLFVKGGLETTSAEMVLTEEYDGHHLSDHFAIMATIELP